MSSVPDSSPPHVVAEAVTPPGSDPLTAPVVEPDAEDSGDGPAPGA